MALIEDVSSDLQRLLEPVEGGAPCGADLDGSLELNALEMACLEPEESVIGGIELADKRNWREIHQKSCALLEKSKDLRVAAQLTRSLLQLEGLPGFCAGLCFVSSLAERYWADLYPPIDPNDGDATMRVNALEELVSTPWLTQLRVARIVAADGLGQITVNDLLLATASPLGRAELSQAPSHRVFSVLDALGADTLREHVKLICDAREQLNRLSARVSERAGAYLQFGALIATKKGPPGLLDAVSEALAGECERLASATNAAPQGEAAVDAGASNRRGLGEIARREDVIMLIERICAYYARVEPSSPVPLLLQRAKRLASMDFVEIVRDLADQGLPQVSTVAGISMTS